MKITASRGRLLAWFPVVPAALGFAACAHAPPTDVPAPARFSNEVRQILTHDERSPEFYKARSRLETMGPEVDAILVWLIRSPEIKTVARANAVTLLADRNSPIALPVLRRVLVSEPDEQIRAAAALALSRVDGPRDEIENLVRTALGDPSRAVRMSALQAVNIRDVAAIRAMLERETVPGIRQVALQLVSLAETRGAPLAPDRHGALRTTGTGTDPQIVFRPVRVDSVAGLSFGDLRVELPNGPDLPLSPLAEVVGNVVPAFFSPDRSRVVFEADRQIRIANLTNKQISSLGPGVAPRPVPFANSFVFLRELPGTRAAPEDGTELRYAVYQARFAGGSPTRVGELHAIARMDRHANYSPVRWMVVAEDSDGFSLEGDGIVPFRLPASIWKTADSETDAGGR